MQDLTRELLDFYRAAWDRIVTQQARIAAEWLTLPRPARRARLTQLAAVVEHLMDHADEQAFAWVHGTLPQAYLAGAVDSGYAPSQWARPDIEAISHLASSTYDNLLTSTRFVRRSTKQLVRVLSREQVAVKLSTGQTAVQAAREFAALVEDHGIHAITYADGARHGLADYADMLLRTQTALAYNAGGFTQYQVAGVEYVECFDDPECGLTEHDDEEKPNGQVYELATMDEFPISHPRCVRSWSARPDITSADEAATASGTASDVQNEDQAALAS